MEGTFLFLAQISVDLRNMVGSASKLLEARNHDVNYQCNVLHVFSEYTIEQQMVKGKSVR